MNRLQAKLLTSIARQLAYHQHPDRLLEIEEAAGYLMRDLEEAYDRATRKSIIPIDVAGWLGSPPTASQRTLVSRALGALEAAGYIARFQLAGCSERNSHVSLTKAGEALAKQLTEVPSNAK